MPSLKDALTKISNIGQKVKPEEIPVAEESNSQVNKPESKKYDEAKVNEYLKLYTERIKVDFPRMYSALNLYPAKCSDEGLITLTFQNNTIVEDFRIRVKPALLSYFRSSIDSEAIEVTEVVVEAEMMEKPTIYSDNEKFQHMITKNPSLQKLKSLFNLDFDR